MPIFPVVAVVLNPAKIRKGQWTDWETLLHEKVKAKSEHEARRSVVDYYLEKGYRIKETRVESAHA